MFHFILLNIIKTSYSPLYKMAGKEGEPESCWGGGGGGTLFLPAGCPFGNLMFEELWSPDHAITGNFCGTKLMLYQIDVYLK